MLITGLVIACTLFLLGVILSGGSTAALFNVPALIIVLGATFGLAIAQSDRRRLRLVGQRLVTLYLPYVPPYHENDLVEWAQTARKEGRLALETVAQAVTDALAAQGLQCLIDGAEPDDIEHFVAVAMIAEEERELQVAEFLEQLAIYAPLMSAIAAVIVVLQSAAQPTNPLLSQIGFFNAGVTLVYGLMLSVIVFLPLASRIRWLAQCQYRCRETLLDALLSISRNEPPRRLSDRLAYRSK